jgi:hypothetical protein
LAVFLAVAAATAGGCLASPAPPLTTSARPPHQLQWSWYQGVPAAGMASGYYTYLCALTTVGGRFEGGGEWVTVTNELPGRGGEWRLFGASQQEDVRGTATCATGYLPQDFKGHYSWFQSREGTVRPPTMMAPSSGNVCFLQYVTGRFRGAGESVSVTDRNGYWWLEGSSMQAGVGAEADCYRADVDSTHIHVWRSETNTSWRPTETGVGTDSMCALTKFGGYFGATMEPYYEPTSVSLYIDRSTGTWKLMGKWYDGDREIQARCFRPAPLITETMPRP